MPHHCDVIGFARSEHYNIAECHPLLWLKELLFPSFHLLFPIEDRLNKMMPSTLCSLDCIKTNRWPGKTQRASKTNWT